MRFNINGRIT